MSAVPGAAVPRHGDADALDALAVADPDCDGDIDLVIAAGSASGAGALCLSVILPILPAVLRASAGAR